jgi:thermostable 8-oxoguanine DNA glycosylase
MIDPSNITNYNRDRYELEEFALFSILVAGKTARVQAEKLDSFLRLCRDLNYTPFQYVQSLVTIELLITVAKAYKLGQYTRVVRAFDDISKLDVKTCTIADLESCYGIGPKTARFFILHTRKNQKVAALDTHILKFLKSKGVKKVPKNTPVGKEYERLEKIFLSMVPKGKSVAEFDLEIWNSYAKYATI